MQALQFYVETQIDPLSKTISYDKLCQFPIKMSHHDMWVTEL